MASKLIRTVGLIILAAALAAPVANAMRTDEQGSPSASRGTVVIPNDRAGIAGPATFTIPYLSNWSSAYSTQSTPSVVSGPTAAALPIASTGDGFNWGTLGLGAAGFLAVGLAIVLLTAVSRRSRHEGDIAVS